MAHRKSLAGIEGKMADLSDCVQSCSAYHWWCARESYIYGASDSDNVTTWSCLNVNRLPSATSTVGRIRARASAIYVHVAQSTWHTHVRTYASPCPSPCLTLALALTIPQSLPCVYTRPCPQPHTCVHGTIYAFLKCYRHILYII